MNAVWQDEEFKEMNVERDKDPAGIPVGPCCYEMYVENPKSLRQSIWLEPTAFLEHI